MTLYTGLVSVTGLSAEQYANTMIIAIEFSSTALLQATSCPGSADHVPNIKNEAFGKSAWSGHLGFSFPHLIFVLHCIVYYSYRGGNFMLRRSVGQLVQHGRVGGWDIHTILRLLRLHQTRQQLVYTATGVRKRSYQQQSEVNQSQNLVNWNLVDPTSRQVQRQSVRHTRNR